MSGEQEAWSRMWLRLGAANRHQDVRGSVVRAENTDEKPVRLVVGGPGTGRTRRLRNAGWTYIACTEHHTARELLAHAEQQHFQRTMIRDLDLLRDEEHIALLTSLRARAEAQPQEDRLVLTARAPSFFVGPNLSSHLTSVVDTVYLPLPVRYAADKPPWNQQHPSDEGATWTGGKPFLLRAWADLARMVTKPTARELAFDLIRHPPIIAEACQRHLHGLLDDPAALEVTRGAALQDQVFDAGQSGVAELAIAGWLVPVEVPDREDQPVPRWRMPGILRRWAQQVLHQRAVGLAGVAP